MMDKDKLENHEIEGERGLPPVNPKKRGGSVLTKLGMIAVGIVALLAILAVNGVFTKQVAKAGPGGGETKQDQAKVVQSNLPDLPPAVDAPQPKPAPEAGPFVPKVIRTSDVPPARPQFAVIEDKGKVQTPMDRKRQGGLFADVDDDREAKTLRTGERMSPEQIRSVSAPGSPATGQGQEGGNANSLASKLTPTVMAGVQAGLLPDRNFLVTQGTFIDCALETAISSDLPGFVSCRVTRDIYSTNGNVLLLERGSKIVGQYQGGLQRGQARIFAVWNRVETPSGVIVTLNSPGTDALGRSGHDGAVDKHFWERFGGAILLSLIDDLGNTAAASASENQGVQIGSTTGAAQEAASIALENSINIPPTLYKNQGEHISIFVARDLDFRGVYGVAAQ